MRLTAVVYSLLLATMLRPGMGAAEDRDVSLPMELHFAGLNEVAIQQQSRPGYYKPVQPRPYQRACGTVATDVCEVAVAIPPGASGEQLYSMAKAADAAGRKGEGLAYLRASAETGYAMAEGVLGTALLTGRGAMRNPAAGVAWLEKSAAQGNRGAEVELGVAYEDGEGVAPDEARAIEYLSAAAQQHHSLAEHRLGLDYEIGRGVPHNRTAAIQWLRRAAADGAPVAATTANALARAGAARFSSVEEIDAYMEPPAPKVKAGACPAFGVTTTGTRAQAMIYTFCACHPGCPYTSPGFSMTCSNAGARPYCNGSY